MNSESKELVIKEEDKIIEYQKDETKRDDKKKSTKEERLNLYKSLLKREEFKRPETKETILDEDQYLTYLEEIIQRDYFPQLYQQQSKITDSLNVKYSILT
jgi:hypothetical protein